MAYTANIELFKENMKFSAGHFTIFSETERERLHGHNFKVNATITLEIAEDGLGADYKVFKTKLRQLCDELDEYFLLPLHSPHLKIETKGDKVFAKHDRDELLFFAKDVKLLPVANTTIEELSKYLTLELLKEQKMIAECKINALKVKVSSGDGQFASYTWKQE